MRRIQLCSTMHVWELGGRLSMERLWVGGQKPLWPLWKVLRHDFMLL